MGWWARLMQGETATGLIKRIAKDTLVSATATLCVSLALSGLTRTTEPPSAAKPAVEIVRVVEVEPVRPMSALAPSPAAGPAAEKAGMRVEDGTVTTRAVALKDAATRPRRPAAVLAAKPEPRVEATAPASASPPLDLLAMTRLSPEPKAGERRWWAGSTLALMRNTGRTVAATAVDVKERVADLTGSVWTAVSR